jgi:hypothetical protein
MKDLKKKYSAAVRVERLKAGASNAEINRELSALKRAYALALRAGKLITKPYIPTLKEDNVRTGFFEREQFECVRQHLPEHVKPVVTLCLYHRMESQ